MPALADDSGLCVHSLRGAPGVHSARYASMAGGEKSETANNQRLDQALGDHRDRRATYIAVLVYLQANDDPRPIHAQGSCPGQYVAAPKGANGYGYTPTE